MFSATSMVTHRAGTELRYRIWVRIRTYGVRHSYRTEPVNRNPNPQAGRYPFGKRQQRQRQKNVITIHGTGGAAWPAGWLAFVGSRVRNAILASRLITLGWLHGVAGAARGR